MQRRIVMTLPDGRLAVSQINTLANKTGALPGTDADPDTGLPVITREAEANYRAFAIRKTLFECHRPWFTMADFQANVSQATLDRTTAGFAQALDFDGTLLDWLKLNIHYADYRADVPMTYREIMDTDLPADRTNRHAWVDDGVTVSVDPARI